MLDVFFTVSWRHNAGQKLALELDAVANIAPDELSFRLSDSWVTGAVRLLPPARSWRNGPRPATLEWAVAVSHSGSKPKREFRMLARRTALPHQPF